MSQFPPLKVLYLDNHLIAVEKPAGLPTQPESKTTPSLLELTRNWIKKEFNKPGNVYLGMVHRLDQPVGGVVLFARTSKAAARLSSQIRERTTQKIYRAVVQGRVAADAGTLVNYLTKGKNLKATVYPRPAPDAKEAELSYKVLTRLQDTTVLEVALVTGRFHQIRAQLAFLGHPILGDVKYGARQPLPEQKIALYARKLVFNHPITGAEMTVEAAEPAGWPFA